jgi:3-hydroxyacyl-CoA dehydrogenase
MVSGREDSLTPALGTFVIDACVSDAINSQYPDEGPFAPRVDEERGCIVNIASAVANPVPARCLTYGPTKTCVLGITTGAADFLGPSGIRVCSLSPSAVASKIMGDRLVSEALNDLTPALHGQ